MKILIYLLLLSVIAVSCNKSNNRTDKAKEQTLSFVSVDYKEQTAINEKTETKVATTIPIAKGDSVTAKNINDKVFNTVRLIVGQENDNSANYDELFKRFIQNYESFVSENTDYKIGWEADVRGTVEYETPHIINIKLVSYTMTGGNHGNPYTTSLLFNPYNGKELTIADLIKDKDSITMLAEKKFREKFNIPAGKSLNSAGYMYNNDIFILPANIFVTKDGLLLFYNVYEIAAYAEGTRELLLPYDEVKNYVSENLLEK
jgi:hypothetical protein